MVFDTSDDRFGAYAKRVSKSAKDKQQAPQRTWDKLESLTNRAVSGDLDASGEQELKETRRLWNREHKNTPVGIMASGVDLGADPFGAQNLYHDMSALMSHDQPKMYDRMYPYNMNRFSKAVGSIMGNTLPARIAKGFLGGGDPIVPQNVLNMRRRFPGIDEVIPPNGISTIVPEHIRNSTLGAINEAVEEGEGIFGGRGDLSPDFDYEEDREGRELSAKISFLESIHPDVDYDNVEPELIDELYEKALAKAAQEEEFMHGNIGALSPFQPD